ncbi:uncharacterized protein LOC113227480 [Hyposmocoma kahamanoa]|uniref:uncharacterized protein LOC113227480 n=1 Tax=Hyposmocoma kahamanoa TaxID=1477025 RepID=UPI000E6D9E0C|nr:uncharacterized protein LOC113227480 [Hyposmocoma kahamanoa]
MSIMYPPGTMPLNPIVELDEQAPESPSDGNVLKFENRKPFFKSALKAIINATQFKLFWEHSSDNVQSYAKGCYWVFYAAPGAGHKITVLDEYDPYTKNESIRTNLVIAITMFVITIVINFFAKRSEQYLKYFESAAGMFTFFIVFGAMLGMHFAMFLIPRTRKIPVNFICLLIISMLASIMTSFLTAKFKTYIIMCILTIVCVSGTVHVFLATSRFDFRRFYLIFITAGAATIGSFVLSALMFILRWFNGPLQVMWTLLLGNAMSICLAMELTLIAQMKTLLLSDEDYCLGGYMLFMSTVDVFIRIVQILIRFDRY